MPIPVIQAPVPNFAESTPVLSGAHSGAKLMDQLAQLRNMASDRNKSDAMTKLYGEQAKFMPLKYALQAAQQQQTTGRFGPAYQWARTLMSAPADYRMAWIANHPKQYDYLLNSLGQQFQASQNPQPTGAQAIVNRLLGQAFPQGGGGQQQPGGPQQAGAMPQAGGMPQITPATTPEGRLKQLQGLTPPQQPVDPSTPSFHTTPGQVEQMSLSAQHLANRHAVTVKTRNRAENAVQLEQWLGNNRAKYAKMMNNVIQYSGAKGRGKRYFESWSNENPKALSDYDTFHGVFSTTISNLQNRLEGMGATDQQKNELLLLVNQVDKLQSDPVRAKMALNKLFSYLQDLGTSVMSAAEPLHKGTYRKTYKLAPFTGNYLDVGVPASAIKKAPLKSTPENDPLGIR